jgi:hypothetical protein
MPAENEQQRSNRERTGTDLLLRRNQNNRQIKLKEKSFSRCHSRLCVVEYGSDAFSVSNSVIPVRLARR